jgi:hypothetical protein
LIRRSCIPIACTSADGQFVEIVLVQSGQETPRYTLTRGEALALLISLARALFNYPGPPSVLPTAEAA